MKDLKSIIPKPLVVDIVEGKCLAFIGAGFSMNANLPNNEIMPNWDMLGKHYANICGIKEKISPIKTAQLFEKKYGRVQLIENTRKALFYDKVLPGEAHKILSQFPFDVVYTTNFDLLLEKAYSEIKRPYRSIVGELQMPFFGGRLLTNIVKMHGDLEHEEHLIITTEDYKDYLNNYPVIATHLSSLLITRTPLFIGYSLTDPDFKNIREIVKSRLGKFERMSYVIQFDSKSAEIEKSYSENLHIISIPSKEFVSKTEAITHFLNILLEHVDRFDDMSARESKPEKFKKVEKEIIKSTDNITFNAITSTTSKTCFVLMPFNNEMNNVYNYLIKPSVFESGLESVRADEIYRPGSIIEQIRTSIRQARVLIADVTLKNPNVMYEIGLAQAMGKPIIFISQEIKDIPFDIRGFRVIIYNPLEIGSIEKAKMELLHSINEVLKDSQINEAERLLENGQIRASMAIAGIALEQLLNNLLKRTNPYVEIRSINETLRNLGNSKILSNEMIDKIRHAYSLRNNAIHKSEEPGEKDARNLIDTCNQLVKFLNEKQ